MGVPIEKKLWRALRKLWKKHARARSKKRTQVRSATTRVRASTAKKATPAPQRPVKRTARPASARTPRGANRLNVIRQWERTAADIDANRAASLREKNELRESRKASARELAEEKARSKAARKASRTERRAYRVAKAEQRATTRTAPTAAKVTRPAPAQVRKPTPAEMVHSALCGANTEDGTPCRNPSLGETCAAGHTPSSRTRRKTTRPDGGHQQFQGESNGDHLRRVNGWEVRNRERRMREQAGRAVPDGQRGVVCRCCGMHHGHDRQQPGHCSWCKGHARATAGSSA